MRLFTLIFLTISSLVFLAHYFLIGQAVYGDGRFYYSYARSLALQGNLDIKDELTHTFSPQDNNKETKTIEEFIAYPVQSFGPAMFWTPILFVSHLIAQKMGLLANGFSDIYQISAGLLSIALTAYAFHRLGKLLLKTFKPAVVFLTLLLVWAGSNLLFYTAIDNLNTHFFSFTLATLTLCEYLDKKKPSLIFTGLLAGLAFQNRQLDLLLHLGLFLAYFTNKHKLTDLLRFFLSTLLVTIPQLMVWNFQFGSFLPPMSGDGFWKFSPSSIANIFFDLPNGLFFTAPVIFISGIFLTFQKKPRYMLYAFFSLLAFLLITSFWWSPLGGASFGPRFLITFYPLLALSLAEKIKSMSYSKIIPFTVIFISLNLIHSLIFLYVSP
ncbi:MAG: hypothetical protein UW35_C0005G0012 [Candidatus Collierbacteria bacterium GW2011_GWF2_44_15]|uniref:Glycosyltransferase RgtA/B/C/D-like domain-containing protein n=5 Tax=Candidatus Collieribacteriota TaxID=1752725 RepID=A0A0G1HJ26_9BACT|nr:MAG: hypothetical protein UW23_C0033G0010 [Candidatus Collierbacteria bacterium GW2011_GWA1_44_12]KKT38347.1 MAG: hypothetical protein UW26_C0017G0012 [Candidatus Collierbacteria bacterium GW2011_GWF1_44_12]KKT46935.1 MAG: hypothetical protein UW35_C0005G0012 [Candidatus Collierbacteria bacterium GW2011_GWF2_44_15]KKU29646.1 MAG: hypothetical protein UX41_C0014G0004 [Candidatus Collierbacteria bacterium GW2011_GWE1_46_18]